MHDQDELPDQNDEVYWPRCLATSGMRSLRTNLRLAFILISDQLVCHLRFDARRTEENRIWIGTAAPLLPSSNVTRRGSRCSFIIQRFVAGGRSIASKNYYVVFGPRSLENFYFILFCTTARRFCLAAKSRRFFFLRFARHQTFDFWLSLNHFSQSRRIGNRWSRSTRVASLCARLLAFGPRPAPRIFHRYVVYPVTN